MDDDDSVLLGAALIEVGCATVAQSLPSHLLATHLRIITARVEAGHYDPEDIVNIIAASEARN